MAAAVDHLERGIEAVGAVDADALTDDELHQAVVAIQRLRDRLGAVAAPLLDRWNQRQVWADDGSRAAAARLARETGSGSRTAQTELGRARALATMPFTAAAAAVGDLSLDQLDLLSKANTAPRRQLFGEREQALIDAISTLRYSDARRAVRYWCQRADAELDVADTTAEQHREASSICTPITIDDMVAVTGLLDPISGAIVTGELDRLTESIRLADGRAAITRTAGQRRAAALVEMARRSATPRPTAGHRDRCSPRWSENARCRRCASSPTAP